MLSYCLYLILFYLQAAGHCPVSRLTVRTMNNAYIFSGNRKHFLFGNEANHRPIVTVCLFAPGKYWIIGLQLICMSCLDRETAPV